MAEPNRECPLRVFCHRFWGRQLGKSLHLTLEASSDVYFVGIFACKCDFHGRRCPHFGKYRVCSSGPNRSHIRNLIDGPGCCGE